MRGLSQLRLMFQWSIQIKLIMLPHKTYQLTLSVSNLHKLVNKPKKMHLPYSLLKEKMMKMKWQSKKVTQDLESNKTIKTTMGNMTRSQLKIKATWMRYQTLKTMVKTKIKATLKWLMLKMKLMPMLNKMTKMMKTKMLRNKKAMTRTDKMLRRTRTFAVTAKTVMKKRARLNNKTTIK